jgi:cobalt-zinc-cadmium efflux system membrane fusion protein
LVPALPDDAILDYQGKKYIFIATEEADENEEAENRSDETGEEHHQHEGGQHFSMIEVETGNSELGYTEIILPEAFDKNSPVVLNGAYSLLSKMKNSEEEGHSH